MTVISLLDESLGSFTEFQLKGQTSVFLSGCISQIIKVIMREPGASRKNVLELFCI